MYIPSHYYYSIYLPMYYYYPNFWPTLRPFARPFIHKLPTTTHTSRPPPFANSATCSDIELQQPQESVTSEAEGSEPESSTLEQGELTSGIKSQSQRQPRILRTDTFKSLAHNKRRRPVAKVVKRVRVSKGKSSKARDAAPPNCRPRPVHHPPYLLVLDPPSYLLFTTITTIHYQKHDTSFPCPLNIRQFQKHTKFIRSNTKRLISFIDGLFFAASPRVSNYFLLIV